MAEITISEDDVLDAVEFLQTFLSEQIPEADFTEGSAFRDISIKAFALIFAYFTNENDTTRNRQALKNLATLPSSTEVDELVDEVLSNWFIERKDGSLSRGVALAHLSERVSITVPTGRRVFRTDSTPFVLDADEDLVIPADDLLPVFSPAGAVTEYLARIPLVATAVGADFNIEPGTFIDAAEFGTDVLYLENKIRFQGGTDTETTAALLSRAQDAVALRALVNQRSISTVLLDEFPLIKKVLAVGMGDPEMIRDIVSNFAPSVTAHVGGHVDVYVDLPRQEVEETLTIGAPFVRPDGLVTLFRDSGIADFSAVPVEVGDIIKITGGIPNASPTNPRQFQVTSVLPDELEIGAEDPFPIATDETGDTVEYSVGRIGPTFDEKIATTSVLAINGGTSRKVQTTGRVILQNQLPVYQIKSVEIIENPGGTVRVVPNRVNGAPGEFINDFDRQYQVTVRNPDAAQSADAVIEVNVASASENNDGDQLRVTYDTISNFDSIDAFVRSPLQRIIAANHLPKGMHPVILSMQIPYALRSDATSDIDLTLAKNTVLDLVEEFTDEDPIDVSDISTALRNQFSQLATLFPFTITYDFLAPDGQVYTYSTQDEVTLFPTDDDSNSSQLTNGINVFPAVLDNTTLNARLQEYGVSDRVVTYFTDTDKVTFIQRT